MFQESRQRRSARPLTRRGRGRAQAACVSCKERKLKCDDQAPSSANCSRLDVACLVEDLSTKRHLPRNYVETLEERVELLQGLLQQQGHSQEQSGVQRPGVAQPRDATLPAAEKSQNGNNGETDLTAKAGVLSLQASGAEPHYFGPSSMFSFSRVIHACFRQTKQAKPRDGFDLSFDEANDVPVTPCNLPEYEIGKVLSNAYFENVHLQYPFLHQPTFRHWERNAAGFGSVPATPTELFFVNMFYSIGSLLKANVRSLPQQLYLSALAHLDNVLSHKNIVSIQALLCCALFSLRSSTGPSVWNLSGLALRQCIELGHHRRNKGLGLRTNVLRTELSKRVFWCAYQMDCASSVNLGLPLSLPIQEVDIDFPLDIDDSCISEAGIEGLPRRLPTDPLTSISHALHQFQLRCIWARIYALLYSNAASHTDSDKYHADMQALRAELDDWMAATPPEPRRSGIPLTVFASMEDYRATYYESILFLYRGHLTSKDGSNDDVFLECMQAASNICQSCRKLYIGKPINYTWSTLHVIFLAGLVYLHCLWTSSTARNSVRVDSASNVFTTCTMLLTIMAERWEGAAPYRNLFEALSSRTMAMMVERTQHEKSDTFGAPFDSDNPNMEDMTQWAAQIADTGMPDAFGSLLSCIIGDFGTEEEAQEFYNSLWNF